MKFVLILINSQFRYSLKDHEFQTIKSAIEYFEKTLNQLFAVQFIPVLKIFLSKPIHKAKYNLNNLIELSKSKYENHQNDFQEEITRDFTDALISAKNDSIKKSKESAPFLTDNNLAVTLNQLFLG